jgi:hypothetical protein
MDLKDIVFKEGRVSFSEHFIEGFGLLAPTRVQGVLRGNELRLKI